MSPLGEQRGEVLGTHRLLGAGMQVRGNRCLELGGEVVPVRRHTDRHQIGIGGVYLRGHGRPL